MDFQVQVGMRQKVKVFEEQLDVSKQASGVLSLFPSDENEMEAPKIITLRINCSLVLRWNLAVNGYCPFISLVSIFWWTAMQLSRSIPDNRSISIGAVSPANTAM
ncbi:hypothetical protein BDV38DRAFT_284723 [Aspergillus pseudotamarii]|uniref:Uncharacterized protein n=1 Tax=Aspergillus pseudotamarii TaxID=132259 RepID=A0A5N6SR73_ASPPS|nr:uncharacterized protein BDV38DRAFT_284723 [Aspergillus pseudotamarii]KAE8135644.1 hypothetical protein BDV38DRAFT_284723 [Aspergillus pseudotamarii]